MNSQSNETQIKISKIDRMQEWSHRFYFSKWSFISLVGISIFFTSLQATLFATGVININGIGFGSEDANIIWFVLAITGIGAIFQFIGVIYIMRFESNKAIFFLPIGSILFIINSIFSGLWFAAITFGIALINVFIRHFIWSKDTDNSDKTTKKVWFFSIFGTVLFTLFGMLMYGYEIFSFYPDNDEVRDWLKYIDVINSTLIILGLILMTFKSKYAFVVFGISGITSVILYGFLGQIIVVVSVLIFKVNDIIGFLAWNKKDKDNEKKKLELKKTNELK